MWVLTVEFLLVIQHWNFVNVEGEPLWSPAAHVYNMEHVIIHDCANTNNKTAGIYKKKYDIDGMLQGE